MKPYFGQLKPYFGNHPLFDGKSAHTMGKRADEAKEGGNTRAFRSNITIRRREL
jgi:hypothetical protein